MLLDLTTDSLAAKTLEAITTTDLQAYVQWHDNDKFLVDTQGRVKKKATVNDALNRIMDQPTENTTNEVANLLEPKMISVFNPDTIPHTVIIMMIDTDGVTLDVELYRAYLDVNEKFEWTPEYQWQVYDADGLKKKDDVGGILSVNGDLGPDVLVDKFLVSLTVTENISQYDIVNGDGSKADSSITSKRGKVIGIASENIPNGFSGNIITEGEVENVLWSWLPGNILYLNGTILSTSAPGAGFSQRIAIAKTATKIELQIGLSILL